MSHALRHVPTVYNGYLRGPVTLSLVAERLANEVSLPVFTTYVSRIRGERSTSTPPRRLLRLMGIGFQNGF